MSDTNRIIILGILPTSTGKVHQQSRIIGGGQVLPLPLQQEITKIR